MGLGTPGKDFLDVFVYIRNAAVEEANGRSIVGPNTRKGTSLFSTWH